MVRWGSGNAQYAFPLELTFALLESAGILATLVNFVMVVQEGGFARYANPLELTFALLKLVRELQTSFAVRFRGGAKKNPTT